MDQETSVRTEHGDRHRAVAEVHGTVRDRVVDHDHTVVLVDDVDEFLAVLSVAIQFLVRRKRPTMRR